jgi:hypothetical protein
LSRHQIDTYVYLESWRATHLLTLMYKSRLYLMNNDVSGAINILHHIVTILPNSNEKKALLEELEEIRNLCVPFNGSCNNPEGKRRTLREKKKRLYRFMERLGSSSVFQQQMYRFKVPEPSFSSGMNK